ncbi:hypothetical protein MKW92_005472, partial [Papaver armeniacum]
MEGVVCKLTFFFSLGMLYYTKLAIGSPSKDYFLHVHTGSDILWINCVGCSPCAMFTDIDH